MSAKLAGERSRAAESLAAGFCPRTPSGFSHADSGFQTGGVLDSCVPDGVLLAWHRLQSWCSANLLGAVAELARRRPADHTPPASSGQFPAQVSEFVCDEVAAALVLTGLAAGVLSDVSVDLQVRLPATARALYAGVIDYPKAKLIAEITRVLSDEHALQVEARILAGAGKQTTGQLRVALARAVIAEGSSRAPLARGRWDRGAGRVQPAAC